MKLQFISALIFCLLSVHGFAQTDWSMAKRIEENIKPPQFKKKDYGILSFGAKADGKSDSRTAINKAIATCSEQGGGRVIVPVGKYYVKGPILLKSRVNLHFEEGAELIFSSVAEDYLPVVFTKWEGTELYNYSPLIYAYKATDIAITGKGVLNGMGSANFANWKPSQKKDQQDIREMGRTGIPVKERIFGKGHYLRPAFLEPVECNNILIEDISLINSTFWVIHPVYCNNVTIRGVKVESRNLNSDGCDPESSTNVLIENCEFKTGDDGIAIKSGRDNDGWRVGRPTENVIIRNCTFETETNAVCIGSEISGGVRNVFVENIKISKAENAIYFKSNLDRGGFIEHIRVRNVTADSLRNSVVKFEPDYKSESKQNYPTRFHDFVIENVTAKYAAEYGADITGFEALPISDVTLNKIKVAKTKQPARIKNALGVAFNDVVMNGVAVYDNSSNKTISLNGTWDVTMGETKPKNYTSKVLVPGVITTAKPKLADDLDGIDHSTVNYNYVWYKRTFDLNEAAYPEAILKIRAKYNVMVWLNGTEIGYDHYSTYSHAEFDITPALNLKGKNELVIRVGSWNTSSSPSKENSAEWWRNSRAPGIWDDVMIELGQNITTKLIKVLPDTRNKITSCEVEIKNRSTSDGAVTITASILDNGKVISRKQEKVQIKPGAQSTHQLDLTSEMLKYWSAGKEGDPKLYTMNVKLTDEHGKTLSDKNTVFGYRNIEVKGKDVLLNGRKTIFRAENIAFVRALNRWPEILFDEQWIRKFLRAAVQDYNLNYLRIHLGHAYSKWYDIADEEGIMLQDEWRYMHDEEPVGKEKEEAWIEFTRWVKQNVNHASIVTWDQENEGNVRLIDLKAELRKYDPTRLWEDDFDGTHNYKYSENIVKTPEFTLSDTKPSTVLESCRLWANEYGFLEPRENFKTSRTSSGWGVFYYTKALMGQLLADIHADLGTFVRHSRMQAWAPFALLSGWVNGQNAFYGNLADSLTPKPSLLTLARINEPVGSSIDMAQAREWYKDKVTYKPNTSFTKKIFIWNDLSVDQSATLILVVKDLSGKIISSSKAEINVPAYQSISNDLSFLTPKVKGVFLIEPNLKLKNGKTIPGVTRRIMVADKQDKNTEGYMGFGGSRTPITGGKSVIEHFLGFDPPENIQKIIIGIVGNGLLDKLTIEGDDKAYVIQSSVYHSSTRSTVTTTRLDQNGKILSSKQSESLNYIDLPDPVKATIVKALGVVPVDESTLIKTSNGDDVVYDITVVGSDLRYKLTMSADGTLKEKEVIRKGDKNRIK